MSFISALPANTVKYSYVAVAVVTKTASDTATGVDELVSRTLSQIDTAVPKELISHLTRALSDLGVGSEVLTIARSLSDSATGMESIVKTVVRLLKLIDTARGAEVREDFRRCMVVLGVLLCYVMHRGKILPEDHNNPYYACRNLLDRLVGIKQILDKARTQLEGG